MHLVGLLWFSRAHKKSGPMSRGDKMAPVSHPESKQRRRQATLSHDSVYTHTYTHSNAHTNICAHMWNLLSGSLSVCLGIYLTFVKASRPQTDATLHVPCLSSSRSRVPCPVCVPTILCVLACFCCCPLFVCWPASSFMVLYILLGFPCMFFRIYDLSMLIRRGPFV